MTARIHTATVQHTGDVFMDHVDRCDYCVVGRQLCAKAKALLESEAHRAADRLLPIPVLVGEGKA